MLPIYLNLQSTAIKCQIMIKYSVHLKFETNIDENKKTFIDINVNGKYI